MRNDGMADTKTVGLIGLGLVGESLARRLIDAGYAVVGYDIDPVRAQRFESLGGRPVGAIAAVARQAERVLIAVFNTEQVADVVEGPGGLIASGNRLASVHSTCDPDKLAALAERAAAHAFTLLEVPLSGTSVQILQGDGVGLIGGPTEAAARMADVLDVICPRRFALGAVGNGSRAKLAVNLVLGLNRAGLAEGLVFAERLGLDPAEFLDVLKGSAAYSQVMETKGPKMVRRDFKSEGKVTQALKDLHMMLDQARAKGQALPLATVNATLLEACVAHGESDQDNSIVIEEIRRRRK
jgi:3-hydroxyisobutyrate dehydrogenase-like beta-hydroxyacid dehydrogenase